MHEIDFVWADGSPMHEADADTYYAELADVFGTAVPCTTDVAAEERWFEFWTSPRLELRALQNAYRDWIISSETGAYIIRFYHHKRGISVRAYERGTRHVVALARWGQW